MIGTKKSTVASNFLLGDKGSEIVVNEGGTLDVNGKYGFKDVYAIKLNGGTLANTGTRSNIGSNPFNAEITLTADSTFKTSNEYNYAGKLNLNGYTLTLNLSNILHWGPSAVDAGTIVLGGTKSLQFEKNVDLSGVSFQVGGALNLQTYALKVKDYVANVATYSGTGALQVYGVFTPNSDNFFPPTMMDGSTIDLSAKEGSWAAGDTTFAEGATIAIEVGERTDLTEGSLLVTWTETEYNGRTFNLTSDGVVRKDLALQAQVGGLAVVSKSAKIPTAVWNGDKSTDALDSENWGWRDAEGHPSLPDGTYVVEIAWNKLPELNWPETNALDYASLVFTGEKPTEPVVLDGDRDWRGLGAMDIPFALDLNGHKLYIVLPGATSVNETTVTSTAEGGELHATVAADKVHDNTSVALTGNLSLIKEGPGTFVATKYPQTYTGETVVREGTLRAADGVNVNMDSTASVTNSPFGGARVITVESAGTLDPRGSYSWGHHTVKLNGGAITNTVAEKGVGTTAYNVAAENYPKPFNPTINLLADSTFATTKEFNFNGEVVADGHELEIWIASDQGLLWVPKAAENAVFVVTNGGYLKTLKNHTFSQETATLKFMGGTVDLAGNLAVSNYYVATSVKDYQYDTRAKLKMMVAGVFTPVSQNFFGCEMLDGATIDLSGQEASWSSLSALVNSHKSTTGQGDCLDVTFAEGATVMIEVGDREFKGVEQIVTWSEGSKASAAKATFMLSAAAKAKGYSLSYDENGLYVGRRGMMLLLR